MSSWDNHEVATGKYAGRPNNSELLVNRKIILMAFRLFSTKKTAGAQRGTPLSIRNILQLHPRSRCTAAGTSITIRIEFPRAAINFKKKAAGSQYIAPSARPVCCRHAAAGTSITICIEFPRAALTFEYKKAARGQLIPPSANARLLPPPAPGTSIIICIEFPRAALHYEKKGAGGQHTASTALGRIMMHFEPLITTIKFDNTPPCLPSEPPSTSLFTSVLLGSWSAYGPWRARELACDLRAGRILGDFILAGPLLALSKIPLTFCRASRHVFGAVIYQETWAARFQLARSTNAWVHLFAIVRNCFATVFAWIWISVHPDVPPPYQSWVALLWQELRVVLIAVIVAEFLYFAARWFSKSGQYLARSCILVMHGFFVSIGGFVSLDGHPVATKTRLEHPLAGPEISGRSKENTISKAVVLTQAMWFIALTTMNIIREVNPVTEYGHQSGVPFVNVQAGFYASDLLGPSNIRSSKIAERRVSVARAMSEHIKSSPEHGIANPPDVGLRRLKM
ncbi:hypothetical protein C8R43DRAFT_948726 [Mycena crocata]|nr:hypothetical protein C8R43DRAFT_948726 [Mycena crocata]